MAAKLGGGEDDIITDINITPFVDIILVVLIIFMVTATTIEPQALKVTLPQAATGESAEPTSLGLTLLEDGALLLDGTPVTTEGLKAAIREARAANSEVGCLIAADKAGAYGRLIWLRDLGKSEGVARYMFSIDKAQMGPPDPASVGEGRGVLPADEAEEG